jgi:hypothetical protein
MGRKRIGTAAKVEVVGKIESVTQELGEFISSESDEQTK